MFIVSSSRPVRDARAWNRSSECAISARIAWSRESSFKIVEATASLSPPALRQTSPAISCISELAECWIDRSPSSSCSWIISW